MTQSFRLLKELLSSLSKRELSSLKKKFFTGTEENDDREIKTQKLVNLIIQVPNVSQVRAEYEIYKSKNEIAFLKLVERIIEKIDEIYVSFNRESIPSFSERNFYFFFLKRKLLIIQMRWLRGVDFDIKVQFERIITLSKRYELYDCLVETLLAKQRFMSFHFGTKAFEMIEKEIIYYEECSRMTQRSRRLFTKIASKINQLIPPMEYLGELKEIVAVLERDFNYTKSASIGYFLYYLQIELYQIHQKYREAGQMLIKQLNLLKNNVSIYTKDRNGEILLNVCSNQIYLLNYKSAVEAAEIAKSFYEPNSAQLYVAMEVEFFARFYNGEIDAAEKIIEEIYHATRLGNSPILFSKRAYLFACIKTIKGEIRKSDELLLDVNEVAKDKGGWNLAKRNLSIINCIETQNFEKADLKIQSLEKFIKRNSKAHNIPKRNVIILRILLKLNNENYDFNKVYKQRKRYFELLEGNDPDYGWKIRSPELIVFHEWFRSKMKPS